MHKKKGPWTVTGTRDVYKNPWITVREDKVIRPDGKPGIYGFIEYGSGVTVVPVDNEGNVYLTKEYSYASERVTTEAISGGLEKGENKLQAAKRELKEETGLAAKKWTYLGVIDPFTKVISSPNYMYLAEGLVKVEDAKGDGLERIKLVKTSFQKALEMVNKSQITHGATCVAILKIAELKKML